MATLTKEMKIFSYQTSPVVGWEGEYGGFSLELFGNGNLRYCTYKSVSYTHLTLPTN